MAPARYVVFSEWEALSTRWKDLLAAEAMKVTNWVEDGSCDLLVGRSVEFNEFVSAENGPINEDVGSNALTWLPPW